MKNIIIKSMLRQRVRTALFTLLIAVASFMFIMRAVEYAIIAERVGAIGGYYRTIGYLDKEYDNVSYNNVFDGTQIIAQSPYVEFEDRGRIVEGVLDGIRNADIEGIYRREFLQENAEYNDSQFRLNDAFFYGTLIGKSDIRRGSPPPLTYRNSLPLPPHIELSVKVDNILSGHSEHIVQNQELRLLYMLTETELEAFEAAERRQEEYGEAIEVSTAIDDMTAGHRYFLRAVYYISWFTYNQEIDLTKPQLPEPGRVEDLLTMVPLNSDTSKYNHRLSGEAMWYVPAEEGAAIDSTVEGLEGLDEEVLRANHSQSAVRVITTADMTAMPIMLPGSNYMYLHGGRYLNHEDHLTANNVAVVNYYFASLRGLKLGDVITLYISKDQQTDRMGLHYHIRSAPSLQYDYKLELEIVGLWHRPGMDGSAWGHWTYSSVYVYIPDSVLPAEFTYLPPPFDEDFLPDNQYNFLLRDSRDKNAFLLENEEAIAAAGFSVRFVPTGADEFWASAAPILQSAAISAAVFCVMLVLVMALAVFLYIRSRRRDYAIMRALGVPVKSAIGQLLASFLCFGVPAIIAGSVVGWFFTLNRSAGTINRFGEVASQAGYGSDASLPLYWLPLFAAAALAALSILITLGAAWISRLSALELLQGSESRKQRRKPRFGRIHVSTLESPDRVSDTRGAVDTHNSRDGMDKPPARIGASAKPDGQKAGAKPIALRGKALFMFRHIIRAKLKTALMLVTAIVIVIALVYLRETITVTESEIDRLYETTDIQALLFPSGMSQTIPFWRAQIADVYGREAARVVTESRHTKNEYLVAGYAWSVLVPALPDGSFPENWEDAIGLELPENSRLEAAKMDILLASNDFGLFVENNSTNYLDTIPGLEREFDDGAPIGDFRIEFAEGFDESSFAYTADNPIPIIISELTMLRRGLDLGDFIYINRSFLDSDGKPVLWSHVPAVVAGVHNRNIVTITRDAAIMPLSAMERMFGREMGYISINFSMALSRDDDLDAVAENLQRALDRSRQSGFAEAGIYMHDAEFRVVVGGMEQNLSLLRMLYPVAAGLSVVVALVLSMLMMLQNAKNAAIMRTLGSTKKSALLVLCTEQLVVCLFGVVFGLCAAVAAGWSIGLSAHLAGLYLAGVLAGSAIGGILVTNRPPLELLQVKE